jgi:hypothetical protein
MEYVERVPLTTFRVQIPNWAGLAGACPNGAGVELLPRTSQEGGPAAPLVRPTRWIPSRARIGRWRALCMLTGRRAPAFFFFFSVWH